MTLSSRDLSLPIAGLGRYKSASQRARVGIESWGAANFFCPACESPRLNIAPRNTVAVDYFCPSCESPFQLKSQSKPIGSRIVDAAYSEMRRAILEDRTPNLYVLHYDLNRHIQPKIRQQLQVLRDLGLLEFLGSGLYRLG